MKKLILSLIATALAAALIYSCSKELEKTNFTHEHENNELKMSNDDIAIMNKIIEFREKAALIRKNPDTLSGEPLSPEDAIWNIETFFNVTYGFPDNTYGKTKADTLMVYLPLNQYGKVMLSDIVEIYDEIVVKTSKVYHASDFANKGLLLVSITHGDTNNNLLELIIRIVTGELRGTPPDPPVQWQPFGVDDNWYYGYLYGDCNLNIGYGDTDAAGQLQETLHLYKPIPIPIPGYRYVYVLDDPIHRFGHEYQNSAGEYLIFYIAKADGNFTADDKCLVTEEMNFHYFGQKEVIYHIIPQELNKPTNWIFMECELTGEEESHPEDPDLHCIHHQNELTYAYRYLVPIWDIGIQVELPIYID
jgi:hypothetical protein